MTMTPEIMQEIAMANKEKSIGDIYMRNCPVYLDNALSTILYFNETRFEYVKDIQIEASLIGFTTMRDSEHVSKYVDIMHRIEYGNTPGIHITMEERSHKDEFRFAGSLIKRPLHFRISNKNNNALFALSQKLDMDSHNIDLVSYLIGYQQIFNEIDISLLNENNIKLGDILVSEKNRFFHYLSLRNIHKIIDYCPITINYNASCMKWSL